MRAIAAGRPDLEALSITRLSANPMYNAQLRTTCVATQIQGGHAVNALPQRASATVNCRVLPGEPIDEVHATLRRVLADDGNLDHAGSAGRCSARPLRCTGRSCGAIERLTAEFWPGVPVIATMSAAGTDSTYLRNAGIPAYGHSGLADDVDDFRAHGKDERVPVKSFFEGQEYLYRLVKMLSGAD